MKDHCKIARVVKGVDLRSTMHSHSWVQTPHLANLLYFYRYNKLLFILYSKYYY